MPMSGRTPARPCVFPEASSADLQAAAAEVSATSQSFENALLPCPTDTRLRMRQILREARERHSIYYNWLLETPSTTFRSKVLKLDRRNIEESMEKYGIYGIETESGGLGHCGAPLLQPRGLPKGKGLRKRIRMRREN